MSLVDYASSSDEEDTEFKDVEEDDKTTKHNFQETILRLLHFPKTRMVAALTNESATSKLVYFAHCTSEMIFITHLLAEEPEKLAGPLLADTYVTLLKGRNAWYRQNLAKGELSLEMGDSIKGKGMIQGFSAVKAFYELLGQSSISVLHPEEKKAVAPVELCPILKTLYKILITREFFSQAILRALRDETHAFYRPLLGHQP